MIRFVRHPFRRISRLTTALYFWEHRKSMAMAGRSIRHEAMAERRSGFDLGRWKALVAGIWRSRDAADRGTVKTVIVDDAQRTVPLATTPATGPTTPPADVWSDSQSVEDRPYTSVG